MILTLILILKITFFGWCDLDLQDHQKVGILPISACNLVLSGKDFSEFNILRPRVSFGNDLSQKELIIVLHNLFSKDCYVTEFYLQISNHFLGEVFFFFRKFYDSNICHFGPAKPNWWALKLGETAVIGMQLIIFCLLLVISAANFDVCSIAFVVYLLNVPLFNFFFSS